MRTVRIPSPFSLLIWAALWEVGGRGFQSDLLPPLSTVIGVAFDVVHLPSFWKALSETAQAFGAGMFLAIVLGIPMGVLVSRVGPEPLPRRRPHQNNLGVRPGSVNRSRKPCS